MQSVCTEVEYRVCVQGQGSNGFISFAYQLTEELSPTGHPVLGGWLYNRCLSLNYYTFEYSVCCSLDGECHFMKGPLNGLVSRVELGGDGAFKGWGLASGACIESLPSTGIVGHWPLTRSLLLPLPHALAVTWL